MPSARTLALLVELPDLGAPDYDPLWDDIRKVGSVGHYYDREGEPLTMRQWATLHSSEDYLRVAQDTIGPYWISTVWLGINHNFSPEGPPIIFETMVFEAELSHREPTDTEFGHIPGYHYHRDYDQRRYATEEEALAGHREICDEIRLVMDATSSCDPRDLATNDD